MEGLWLHSLASAYGARAIAQRLTLGDVEKFFLMGLVHDIGKAPLLKILTESCLEGESIGMEEIVTSIQEVHTSFGGALLKRWGFSQEFNAVAIRHEGSHYAPETEKPILVVNLANKLAHSLGYGIVENVENGELTLSELDSAKMLKLNEDTLNDTGEHIKGLMEESHQLF
jgi:putative nucleotidyltransferase with HDIG domain